ncbi:MAG: potassium-transporting ATPase subunit KdpC [Candidatus Obscuribacterales bacterium]|nr:potassium-transporting ATPase subunit KdpC [Candidatus Obscuribacterales bacterium]
MMLSQIAPAIRLTVLLAIATGIIFPFVITAIAQLMLPHQSNGSLIAINQQTVGSELLGQLFVKPEYFHGRPSAAGSGYSGESSSGTNYGPTSKKLILGGASFAGVKQLAENYRKENNLGTDILVPVDAVTRSSSGLDPDISPQNALLQSERVAQARGINSNAVNELIKRHTNNRDLGLFGQPRVNVLQLNLALDSLKQTKQ